MKILLVEDNTADAALLEKQLVETGAFEVNLWRCRNVVEAEKLSNDERFDVVLLDLDLPDRQGIGAVKDMQSACPNTPIVVLSGEENENSALAALSLGAEDYVIKGHLTIDALADLVTAAVERHAQSGWDGKLQSLPVPENPTELEQFARRLRPLVAADAVNDTRTVVFAARIERSLDRADRIVDLDHSVFVVNGVGAAEDIDSVTDELTRALSVPMIAGRDRVRTSVSLGIAVSPDDAQEPAELLAKALHALGGQQTENTGRWKYYSEQLNRRSAHRQRLLVDVGRAIDSNRLHLQFQPIVDARAHIAVRLEALLRWSRSDGFVTSADTFMPFIEENGLVQRVDEYVIDRVGRQLQRWQVERGEALPIAINVSARSLKDGALTRALAGMLERYAIEPRLVELEVTESTAIADVRAAAATMAALRELGIGIALDDFGCAYASLDYLRHLPVSRLKIDKAFVRDISDRRTAVVTRSVITMAHDLDIRVTAEGIETREQAATMAELGCDELQGFYFARPARAGDELAPTALTMQIADG
ncbi:MAG: EAL domain-containing protein [Pseudomonadota bacterium]